ncbi:MAG: A/G-specific adenine glycosylase [Actinomycetota bacterium]
MTDTAVSEFRRLLLAWGRRNRRSFPWRETDDPFRVLIAEVLLQRSRGKTVAAVYERLFTRWPDAASLANARESTIAAVIRPLGLVKRAATLRALAREVVSRGEVPSGCDALLSLPGVGTYVAGATSVVAFGRRAPVVDGVTARVYRRYFGLDGDPPASTDPELWAVVEQATPLRSVKEWNWAVLDLASAVCLPKVPRCEECPLTVHCAWSRASI